MTIGVRPTRRRCITTLRGLARGSISLFRSANSDDGVRAPRTLVSLTLFSKSTATANLSRRSFPIRYKSDNGQSVAFVVGHSRFRISLILVVNRNLDFDRNSLYFYKEEEEKKSNDDC